jgi:nitrate/nitrite transporter NarK
MAAPTIAPVTSPVSVEEPGKGRVLGIATIAFTLMFAVWMMFGVLGIPIRDEFGLSQEKLSWISAVAILNGAIWRLPAGIITDRIGGRRVFIYMLAATAVPAYLVLTVTSYQMLLVYAFLVGFAGNSFIALVFVIGCAMGIGKAAVFKNIPEYFPKDVGASPELANKFEHDQLADPAAAHPHAEPAAAGATTTERTDG